MSMFEYLFTTLAGFTLLLIGLSVLGVLIYGPLLSFQLYLKKKKSIKKSNVDAMLVLGVIVFISGILNQIGGMIEALETMVKATDISPQLVMSGLMESFKVPIFCSFVLIISLIFWHFNKKKWEVLNSKDS
jgi:ABC-type polysaccharide/polyol phosphate export permease